MVFEQAISAALEEQAYLRMGRFSYRATWSTSEVEHLLYFWRWNAGKVVLSADFGMRNVSAEAFAIECVRAYGGEPYRIWKVRRTDCTMRFSFGKLADWAPRWSIPVQGIPVSSLAERVKDDIRRFLLPAISGVTDERALFGLLTQDAEPWPWYRVNGAIRAAQIAFLGSRLGMGTDQIIELLRQFSREVTANLAGEETAGSYIEAIVRRAAAVNPG